MKKNNKALSEVIAYVLLILISLSLAGGVYVWLKFQVSPFDREKCPEDTAISVNDYSCFELGLSKRISLELKNRGNFNIDGFYIRASNDSDVLPSVMLNTSDIIGMPLGFYYFATPLKFDENYVTNFTYNDLGRIERIQIQPFVKSNSNRTILCKNIADIKIEGCGDQVAPVIIEGLCYQETANIATSCGGLSTGISAFSGTWNPAQPATKAIDGDWNTFGQTTSGMYDYGAIYINYTKPIGAQSTSLWQIKDGTGQINLTIPSNCWNAYSDKLAFMMYSSASGTWINKQAAWYCITSDGSTNRLRLEEAIRTAELYEEAMIWNITNS